MIGMATLGAVLSLTAISSPTNVAFAACSGILGAWDTLAIATALLLAVGR